jgi:hypothetical protein
MPHLSWQLARAGMAMTPDVLGRILLYPWRRRMPDTILTKYARKGCNVLRGLLMCENHADVLATIADMLRRGDFADAYRNRRELQAFLTPGFGNESE